MGRRPPRFGEVRGVLEARLTVNVPSTASQLDVEKARAKVARNYHVPVELVRSVRVEGKGG